jgi:hypothetical protein
MAGRVPIHFLSKTLGFRRIRIDILRGKSGTYYVLKDEENRRPQPVDKKEVGSPG